MNLLATPARVLLLLAWLGAGGCGGGAALPVTNRSSYTVQLGEVSVAEFIERTLDGATLFKGVSSTLTVFVGNAGASASPPVAIESGRLTWSTGQSLALPFTPYSDSQVAAGQTAELRLSASLPDLHYCGLGPDEGVEVLDAGTELRLQVRIGDAAFPLVARLPFECRYSRMMGF